jgi:hypothetical protein
LAFCTCRIHQRQPAFGMTSEQALVGMMHRCAMVG